ncbi:MAG: trypsin-like peptidase domain-containing protein [Deltaproteobacteria bacterium]|nr:trypsin-like peptidase domain-containing protein [Deltaproteobacteria bacterium]
MKWVTRGDGASMKAKIAVGVCAAGFIAGLAGCEWRGSTPQPPVTAVPQASPNTPPLVTPQITSSDEENNIEIYKRASPSTVFITNTALRRDLLTLNVFEIPQGTGTGFVWSREGYIVTNTHVIEGARRIVVGLGKETYQAELVGVAASLDIAVLKIKAPPESLLPLPLGDSASLRVGQKVLAIGNPFGLDTTLTTGIISALGREISAPNGRRIRDVVQTDAAINPGNSGGPLLDSSGRLIGVNTAIIGPGGGSAGIGFAVPSKSVAKVVPQLIEHGRVIRPVLGINLVQDQMAREMNITGAVVLSVAPKLGAGKAGLRGLERTQDGKIAVGDVIVGIGTYPVKDNDDLLNALEQFKPGQTVPVKTQREGKERTLMVELSESE